MNYFHSKAHCLARTPSKSQSGARPQGLTLHMGVRLQNRRLQLGLTASAVAAHVGVSADTYEQYEQGEAQLPATMLAEIAELFKVPLFYFFQDLPLESPTTEHEEPTAVLTVATPADRASALVADFQKLEWQAQQYLLMLAQALVRERKVE
jgi:transcriptional regulator with XRE-family HTH domain